MVATAAIAAKNAIRSPQTHANRFPAPSGFGGRSKGPLWVDSRHHTAIETGDEPLLLVRAAPTLVARNRKVGAQEIEAHGGPASVIIMDDGMQNPSLVKDLSIAIVDARRGLGNGRVIPAGPLRAPFGFQIGLCDAIAVNGAADNEVLHANLRRAFSGPILRARVEPDGDTAWLRGARIVAFAGIGNPQRFFDELAGADVIDQVVFRDHQALSADDACHLLGKAEAAGAMLVTTQKDWVRLSAADGPLADLKRQSRVLTVRFVLEPGSKPVLDQLLRGVLKAHRAKTLSL